MFLDTASVLSGYLTEKRRWTVTDLARFTAGVGWERMRENFAPAW